MTEIQVSDLMENPTGEFPNYSTPATTTATRNQQAQLQKQKHVDLRTFKGMYLGAHISMLYLNLQTMDDLTGHRTMGELAGEAVIRTDETWTNGAIAQQTDRNYWWGMQLTCPASTTTTASSVISTLYP